MPRVIRLVSATAGWLGALLALQLGLGTSSGVTQDRVEDEPFLPGLVASIRDAKGNSAVRMDHQLAFHWGESAPDPRVSPGEFRATWQGHIYIQARGEHRFYLHGNGEVELKVAGREVLARRTLRNEWHESPALALPGEFVPVELSFRRTEKDARLMVLWAGPDFKLEPIPARLLFHARERAVANDFERGHLLARVLRCGHCHGDEPSPPAPALDRLAGNVARDWLVRWLIAGEHDRRSALASVRRQPPDNRDPSGGSRLPLADHSSPRRMPSLGLSNSQAEAIADWLLAAGNSPLPEPTAPPEKKPQKNEPKLAVQKKEKKAPPSKPKPNAKSGERLFVTLGCLACHTWRDLGASGWLGGGDLSHIADKRPAAFFASWLADPSQLNRDHRMPVFTLADDERISLALFLAEQKSAGLNPGFGSDSSVERRAQGQKLVEQFRCAACHRLPAAGDRPSAPGHGLKVDGRTPNAGSAWEHSCLDAPDVGKHRPGYQLAESDARIVRLYYTNRRPAPSTPPDGRLLLAEHNCLACHAREGTREAIPLLPPLLADKLTAVAKRYPDMVPLMPELTPPALNSAGDKLTDEALADAISRRGEPHRPYLQVRMPRFSLSDGELHALVRELVETDRIPPRGTSSPLSADQLRQDGYGLAGGRLVSSDGFGCTSCHQVGSVLPSQAQLNARGPSLSHLDRRIRREWFDRFVPNPARIVPRMEMPSVQIPVAGVLDDKIGDQLAAVWHVLNLPKFEPPLPGPIRTLRHLGHRLEAEPLLVTDVLEQGNRAFIKPFLVGLANRHNVVLDLDTARLALWTAGDTARQRTKGKTWFWELAGVTVLDPGIIGPDITLVAAGRELSPEPLGQFLTEADAWQVVGDGVLLQYRLRFVVPENGGVATKTVTLQVRRKLAPLVAGTAGSASGFAQEFSIGPLPSGTRVHLHVLSPQAAAAATRHADGRAIKLGDRFASRIDLQEPAGARFSEDATSVVVTPKMAGTVHALLHYQSEIPIDRFPELPSTPEAVRTGEPVDVAPGFIGERLPLPAEIMPSGLTWRPEGRLVFCSLKGQVFEAADTDGDGNEDRLTLLADGLPTPYGVHAGTDYVDVSAKYALLRLWDASPSGRRVEVLASGWGYTRDYHDWAIGLPKNERGEYFLGIPCQQDKRSAAAARLHGNVLRLVPRRPDADDPRAFALEPISAGHRFPTGLALDRHGELLVTDNQGNYNPFNELNHVRPGVHFGFINALDRGKPAPRLTPPAIDIPHPWTRSVNGIGFLYTPKELRTKLGRDAFGPLEGHLIGCEYDTRRLIRMTLERIGDSYQGAAYPLSVVPQDPKRGFLGPVVCAVSPRGELYVGSIRDSGWGAGNNVGEIVRIHVDPDKLPCGIQEVRAARAGFVLTFLQAIDPKLAGSIESYAVQSYRRESTPAYGGPDLERRTEKVLTVTVSPDSRQVTIRLAELRPGFLYEFRLKNLAPGGAEFYPAEAHYTLRVVPH